MANYRTPGVYVEEIPKFPPSIAAVETAIPAFIGYTEKAIRKGESLVNKPTRIESIAEYEELFGFGPSQKVTVTLDSNNNVIRAEADSKLFLYDSLRMFYANGGGNCYIISVGPYKSDGNPVASADLEKALEALEKEDEPTIILAPDAVSDANGPYAFQTSALAQCKKLMDRVVICDLVSAEDNQGFKTKVDTFRQGIGINYLKYGAAYGPWIRANLPRSLKRSDLTLLRDGGGEVKLSGMTNDEKLLALISTLDTVEKCIKDTTAKGESLAQPKASLEDRLKELQDNFHKLEASAGRDLVEQKLQAMTQYMVAIIKAIKECYESAPDPTGSEFKIRKDIEAFIVKSGIGESLKDLAGHHKYLKDFDSPAVNFAVASADAAKTVADAAKDAADAAKTAADAAKDAADAAVAAASNASQGTKIAVNDAVAAAVAAVDAAEAAKEAAEAAKEAAEDAKEAADTAKTDPARVTDAVNKANAAKGATEAAVQTAVAAKEAAEAAQTYAVDAQTVAGADNSLAPIDITTIGEAATKAGEAATKAGKAVDQAGIAAAKAGDAATAMGAIQSIALLVKGLDLDAIAKFIDPNVPDFAALLANPPDVSGKYSNAASSKKRGEVALTAVLKMENAAIAFFRFLETTQATYEKALNDSLFNSYGFYKSLVSKAIEALNLMPPSGAIAGVYAATDRDRGVWKAPANISLNKVIGPAVTISHEQQGEYNVDSNSGKSINIIRSFTGKGTLVWGARTLAGNDNEWRYVNVRRFFNMVEESTKKATEQFVFEPNDANTWVKMQAMIENFLTTLWRQGALQGAKPEHAFYVAIGLGKTMTALDILEGRLIVEIGMAVVRPAEFIILKFSHKMPES